ncbi:MAG: type II toxin-antitoxin system VapC family toxin [Thaumarchaeota archaeon]|nr:type II toxin-antitoxin system VapC family toxin [Nitrososphaerota archaeon]
MGNGVSKEWWKSIVIEEIEMQKFRTLYKSRKTSGLTAYDSSYLTLAEKLDLVLVTDDRELERAARKYVKVMKTSDL